MTEERTKEQPKNDSPTNGTAESHEAPPATALPESPPVQEDLRVKLEEAQKAAETYRDQFLRKAAELENYRRRSEAEYLNLVRNAGVGILGSLIPVMEDFARSLKSMTEAGEDGPFAKGVELIYQKLVKALEQHGLTPFESLGKPFNVEYHDALLQMPRSDVPAGTVIEEVERGYMLHDRVLRHAKVIVSTAGEEPSAGNGGETAGT
ncbi:MAG: nucleotide exchange factor GrpE [Bacteroidota bacterium]